MSAPAQAIEAAATDYDLGDGVGLEGLPSVRNGTNILISGPSLLGPDRIALDILECGCRRGEHAVVVTPDVPPSRLAEDLAVSERGDGLGLHFVDCCAGDEGDGVVSGATVERVASPGNLTGIGVGLTKATQSIGEDDPEGVRVALLSLSTLLQYADVDSVFRFVHVATSRFAAAGYLGVATVDSGIHGDRTLNKLKAQFDGAVELRDGDEGAEYRILGLPGASSGWIQR